MTSLLRYLKWLFNFVIQSGLKSEVTDNLLLIRGGNGAPFDKDSLDHLIYLLPLEAERVGAKVDVLSSKYGIEVRFPEDTV